MFLRNADVPHDLVVDTRSRISKSVEFYSCFLSYSHQDKPFARRFHDQIQARGIPCWLDEKQ